MKRRASSSTNPPMDGEQTLLPLDATPPPVAKPQPHTPARTSPPRPRVGIWAILCKALRMQHSMPCVGLVVLAGCLTFVIAPDEQPGMDSRIAAALDPALPTVVIDPGHGGRDEGAKANGLVEKNLTLDLAFRVERLLQTFGFKTLLTRRDDTYFTLEERAALANQIDHSFFVSLHFNQASNSAASGVETYYASEKVAPEAAWNWVGYFNKPEPPAGSDTGETFAGYVQTALISRTDATNRGIKARKLYVVRHTRSAAVLVEGGFLSNPFDARLIATPEYRDRLAAAIVEGVIHFQKTQPRPEPPAQLAKTTR